MSPAPARHVFVYGTLRLGQERDINRLRPAPRWLGRASVRGVLYQLGRYPGIVLGGAGLVQGEVYAISTELELQLDMIEGVGPAPGDEYIKREIALRLEHRSEPSAELVCLVYELAPGLSSGKELIGSGDWAAYLTANAR